jgi:hypothetical protein
MPFLSRKGAKPFRQKLRHINPKLAPQIQKELQKMVDAKIIAPIRYSSWMANLVVVQKKSGDIHCVWTLGTLINYLLKTIILSQTWNTCYKESLVQDDVYVRWFFWV